MAMNLPNGVSQSVQNVRDILTKIVSQSVDTVTEITHQAVDTVTTTTEQVKASLEDRIQQTEKLSGIASETIQNAIISIIRDWINAHPKVFWLVSHPILTLVILLVAILVLWGFLKALSNFFEKAWLSLWQAVMKLNRLLFGFIYQHCRRLSVLIINKVFSYKEVKSEALDDIDLSAESSETESSERLLEILSRLEAINQEQKKLLQEVAAILNYDKTNIN